MASADVLLMALPEAHLHAYPRILASAVKSTSTPAPMVPPSALFVRTIKPDGEQVCQYWAADETVADVVTRLGLPVGSPVRYLGEPVAGNKKLGDLQAATYKLEVLPLERSEFAPASPVMGDAASEEAAGEEDVASTCPGGNVIDSRYPDSRMRNFDQKLVPHALTVNVILNGEYAQQVRLRWDANAGDVLDALDCRPPACIHYAGRALAPYERLSDIGICNGVYLDVTTRFGCSPALSSPSEHLHSLVNNPAASGRLLSPAASSLHLLRSESRTPPSAEAAHAPVDPSDAERTREQLENDELLDRRLRRTLSFSGTPPPETVERLAGGSSHHHEIRRDRERMSPQRVPKPFHQEMQKDPRRDRRVVRDSIGKAWHEMERQEMSGTAALTATSTALPSRVVATSGCSESDTSVVDESQLQMIQAFEIFTSEAKSLMASESVPHRTGIADQPTRRELPPILASALVTCRYLARDFAADGLSLAVINSVCNDDVDVVAGRRMARMLSGVAFSTWHASQVLSHFLDCEALRPDTFPTSGSPLDGSARDDPERDGGSGGGGPSVVDGSRGNPASGSNFADASRRDAQTGVSSSRDNDGSSGKHCSMLDPSKNVKLVGRVLLSVLSVYADIFVYQRHVHKAAGGSAEPSQNEGTAIAAPGSASVARNGAGANGGGATQESNRGRGGSGGDGDEPPRRSDSLNDGTCGDGGRTAAAKDGEEDDVDDVSVGDEEMDEVIGDMEMDEAADAVLYDAMPSSDDGDEDDEDILDSIDVEDVDIDGTANDSLSGDGAVAALAPVRLAAMRPNVEKNVHSLVGHGRLPGVTTRAPGTATLGVPAASKAGSLRFGSAATRATSSGSMSRSSPNVGGQTDGFDAILGMREAARVRAVLVRDAERLGKESRRRPLSRGYRQAGDSIEFLTPAFAGHLGANAMREGLQGRLTAANLETLLALAETPRMGMLLMREIEAALRTRISVDPDFDASRFPLAAARFGTEPL